MLADINRKRAITPAAVAVDPAGYHLDDDLYQKRRAQRRSEGAIKWKT